MDKEQLKNYVASRLKEGARPDAIKQDLILVGWSEEEAGSAVVAGLIASGAPVPPSGARRGAGRLSSTVEVVINFFSFILLGFVATSLGILYYQVINHFFPDPLKNISGNVSTNSIHYAIASLIIAYPLYVLSIRLWFRRFKEDEEKVESRLTKWLTYLVLLVASLTIVGDLITALFYLLQGEFTVRFLLKALTILVIAGVIFGFYFLERKKIQYHQDIPEKTFRTFGWTVLGLVLFAIILGFVVGGSPSTERARTFDAERSSDLRNLAQCIGSYAYLQKALPSTLADLSTNSQYAYCANQTNDPETGVSYEYRIVNPSFLSGEVLQGSFELCAVYSLNSENDPNNPDYSYANDKWAKHPAGRDCDTEVVPLGNTATMLPPVIKTIPQTVPSGY